MSAAADARVESALAVLRRHPHDRQAWSDLYTALAPRALAQSYRLLGGNTAAAQDACHDAILRLLKLGKYEQFSGADELGRYFSVVVRHVCIDKLRRSHGELPRSFHPELGDDIESEELCEPQGHGTGAAGPEAIAEQTQTLKAAQAGLNSKERVLLQLLRLGYTVGEIAARLGLSYLGTAKRLERLRDKLVP